MSDCCIAQELTVVSYESRLLLAQELTVVSYESRDYVNQLH